MPLFKKRIPAKTVALTLMVYTITGDLDTDDPDTFALGPHLFSSEDGRDVLPETEERSSWDQLSGDEVYKKELEIRFLRGWAVWFIGSHAIKATKARESVLQHYDDYWRVWSSDEFDYHEFWDASKIVYGARWLAGDLEQGMNPLETHPWTEESIRKFVADTSAEFVDMCDYNDNYSASLKSELQQIGETLLMESLNAATDLITTIQESYRITA